MSEPDTERQFQTISESLARLETLVKERQKDERLVKWITLVATIVSTIVVAGFATLASYRFGEQNHILQAAVAAQNQIHDLSSEQENTRYGAELYLAKTQYADLVIRQAVEFGDADILKVLEVDAAINPDLRTKFKNARESLLRLVEPDKACYDGIWKEDDQNHNKVRLHTIKVIGPKRLLIYRGGDDGGFWLEARKVDEKFWLAPDFSWGAARPSASVRLVPNDNCTTLDSNWGWHYQKLLQGKNTDSGGPSGKTD